MSATEMNKLQHEKIKNLISLTLVDEDHGVNAIHGWYAPSKEFKRFLIKTENHKITELWGFYGRIAYEDKTAYRLM